MAADIILPRGDYGFYLNFTIKDSDGAAFNITGYTIKFKMWKVGSPNNLKVNGTCSAVVEANGTCRYLTTITDFTAVGTYIWELEMTKSGAQESTDQYTLEVVESG